MTTPDPFAIMSAYLRARAQAEGQAYDLSPAFFEVGFKTGMRVFFGFETDDRGNIIDDKREPTLGFLAAFLRRPDLASLTAAEPKTTLKSLARRGLYIGSRL